MPFGIAAGVGALGGGLLGAFANDGKANFTNPNFINQFNGPLGNSTRTGFTFAQDPSRQGAVDFANQGLQPALGNVLSATDPNRIQQFQNAFINARRPQLEQALALQAQQRNANAAGQGLSGSSSSILARTLGDQQANQQRNALFNQGIIGGENLANQALNQNLAKFGAANAFSQQDIGNRLAAFGQTQGAFNNQNQFELQKSQFANQLAKARAGQSNNRFKNIIGGAVNGAQLGAGLGGFGSLFGGGGAQGVPSSLGAGGDGGLSQARLLGLI